EALAGASFHLVDVELGIRKHIPQGSGAIFMRGKRRDMVLRFLRMLLRRQHVERIYSSLMHLPHVQAKGFHMHLMWLLCMTTVPYFTAASSRPGIARTHERQAPPIRRPGGSVEMPQLGAW